MRIKSFLIGCAGGLFALTSAQAADLPVKAKPVEYVKICSLYGVGFYYIPGTDMCIKVGGYVRAQYEWGSTQGLPFGSSYNGLYTASNFPNAFFNRQSDNIQFTGRAMLTADARNQSEYGTVRAYIRIGAVLNNADASTFVAERAFIQFAGFTFGQTQSFFDIFSTTELMSYFDAKTSGDTYTYGVKVLAYTAQFGNGFSGTIAAELGHYPAGVVNGAAGGFNLTAGASPAIVSTSTAGFRMPDIIGNLRLDQNWGFVGVSGAIHQVAGRYYGSANSEIGGHPDDKYGWAASAGGLFYLPWLGAGDSIGANFAYSKGAIGYVTKAGSWQMFHGDGIGVGWVADGVYDNNIPFFGAGTTPIELTSAWSVTGGYEHFWNPRWRTSLYGGYTRVWYDQNATNLINQHLPTPPLGGLACGVPVEGAVFPPIALGNGVGNSCSPNFSFWQVGSRTQWNVTKDFFMGVDVLYTHLNTAYQGPNVITGAVGTIPSGVRNVDDQSVVSGIFRAQMNFEARNEGTSFVFGQR
jgi:hypothetical protein